MTPETKRRPKTLLDSIDVPETGIPIILLGAIAMLTVSAWLLVAHRAGDAAWLDDRVGAIGSAATIATG